ncbi:hypothetical protein C8J48_2292 [Desmospora activa DSM 45169]|uniref:Uncharacterized protein n=1 Tax=Desmospora activa DSM 45169 TaxID=1121389 RepID=A0A2T4ZCQ0_9BACL|nr:hypothetical protein C8J48_2292 [Desmospora activa DSM 45169]
MPISKYYALLRLKVGNDCLMMPAVSAVFTTIKGKVRSICRVYPKTAKESVPHYKLNRYPTHQIVSTDHKKSKSHCRNRQE